MAVSLTVNRGNLIAALAPAVKILERRNTIPILGNVLIGAGPEGIEVVGTDLDIEIRTKAPADIDEGGAFTVPGHALLDIVRKLPEAAQVKIAAEAGSLSLRAGRSRFVLHTLPPGDFPSISEGGAFPVAMTLAGKEFAELLGAVEFAISTEETRYYLNGTYLHAVLHEGSERLRAVATDGHRLARADTAKVAGLDTGMRGVIVPRKAAGELRRLTGEHGEGEVTLEVSESKLRAVIGDTTFTTKLIDGTFPDYQRVIPTGNDRRAKVATATLTAALARVMAVAGERGRAVRLTAEAERLTLTVINPDAGQGEDEVEAEFDGPEGFAIGLQGRYLADILGQVGDAAVFAFGDPMSPVLIQTREGADQLYVLMPMRV